jgi:ABC-type glycerol-3-phosphate transport system substrate-binding protein
MTQRPFLLAALGAAALLAACGGGSDGAVPVTAPDTVPASATASPATFTQYVAMQATDDQREPLAVDGLTPPTSDTAEPLPVAR